MKVLICGGGCAGPAVALLLVRLGHQVTIVERFDSLRASGAQIDLRAQGITAVKRMGLLPGIRKILVDEAGAAQVDGHGRVWGTVLANKSGKGAQGPTSEYEMMRGDLVRLLYDETKQDVEYIFGKSVTSFDQNGKKVDVRFSDGSRETYDLLVGADGQGSRIRKAFMPDNTDPYVHTGLHVAYWFVPRIKSDTNIRETYRSPGGRQIMRRSHNPTESQAYFILMDQDPSARSIHRASEKEQKEFWKQRFQGAGWQTDRFIQGMETTDNWYSAEIVQVRIDSWHQGRVVLLGDAACCPSPMSGMGTTNAFVGAYVLAGELSKSPDDLDVALKSYEDTLRPFIDETQKVPFRFVKLLMPQTSWAIKLLNWISWVVCSLKVPNLIMRFSSEDKGGWSLPVYPELKDQG
ncbi:hypothetical protein NLU13_8611 [Sarocladium strictum]|uniref:FAD-binding domain-containing protein n=1 Tax=Sarocladium strictum TaxID=5046 RepID=A0AA39G9J9_SARSR|nr:hypothetical protein NLU13_9954 [Sarocladium strictum]KAK0384525.1 hypothetical protein NLU13_8611 [Sarocladium strictum]